MHELKLINYLSIEKNIIYIYNCIFLEHGYTSIKDKNGLYLIIQKFAYPSE